MSASTWMACRMWEQWCIPVKRTTAKLTAPRVICCSDIISFGNRGTLMLGDPVPLSVRNYCLALHGNGFRTRICLLICLPGPVPAKGCLYRVQGSDQSL